MTSLEILRTLIKLHNDEYSDDLVGDDFNYIVWRVLTDKQRQILFFKVDGLTNKQVSLQLDISERSLKRRILEIKAVYRNGMTTRVDDKVRYFKYLDKAGRLPTDLLTFRKMRYRYRG